MTDEKGKMERKKNMGKFKKIIKEFYQDEAGIGVVEIILIVVVLIGLVIIFRTNIEALVNKIFKTINTKTDLIG